MTKERELLAAALKAAMRHLPGLVDVLCFGGIACVAYGVSYYSVPGAWIVAGLALFYLGVKGT